MKRASFTLLPVLFVVFPLASFVACSLNPQSDELEVEPVPIAGGYIKSPGSLSVRVDGQNIIVDAQADAFSGEPGLLVAIHQLNETSYNALLEATGTGDVFAFDLPSFMAREQVTVNPGTAFSASLAAGTIGAGFLPANIEGTFVVVSVIRELSQPPNRIYVNRAGGDQVAAATQVAETPVSLSPIIIGEPTLPSDTLEPGWTDPEQVVPGSGKFNFTSAIGPDRAAYTAWWEQGTGPATVDLHVLREDLETGETATRTYSHSGYDYTTKTPRIATSRTGAVIVWIEDPEPDQVWDMYTIKWNGGWPETPNVSSEELHGAEGGFELGTLVDSASPKFILTYQDNSGEVISRVDEDGDGDFNGAIDVKTEAMPYPLGAANMALATRGNGQAFFVGIYNGVGTHYWYLRRYTDGEGWGTAWTEQMGSTPKADSARTAGALHAVMSEAGKVVIFDGVHYAVVRPDDIFEGTRFQEASSENVFFPGNYQKALVDINAAGDRAILLWADSVGSYGFARSKWYVSGTWLPNEKIGEGEPNVFPFGFALDGPGNGVAILHEDNTAKVYQKTFSIDSGWSDSVLLHESEGNMSFEHFGSVTYGNGRFMVDWLLPHIESILRAFFVFE